MKNYSIEDDISSPDAEYRTTAAFIKRALLLMVSLLAALFVVAIFSLLSIANSLNRDADERSGMLLQKALHNRVDTLSSHIKDYAWWGEAYANLHVNVDADWAYNRQNMGSSLYRDFGYEGVFVLDGTEHNRYSVIRGQLSSRSLSAWLGVDPVPTLRQSMNRSDAQPLSYTMVLKANHPALVAMAKITNGDDKHVALVPGPPSMLVFVDVLDDKKLAQMGEFYGIHETRVQDKNAPRAQGRRGTLTLPVQGQTITLEWKSEEPGRQLIHYILPLLVLLAAGCGALAWVQSRNLLKKARMYDENSYLLAQSRQALTASERRFRDVAEATTDWIWETDNALRFTWLSDRFPGITGHSISSWLGRPVTDLMEADNVPLAEWITLPGQTGHRRLLHCKYRSAMGHQRYCHIAIKPVITAEGVAGYRGTATDVTLEVEAQERVQYLSRHDELTGLPNRVRMREFLEGKLRALPTLEHPLAMISLDLDKFKPVNDLFGHGAGDKVLHEVSTRLRNCIRDNDLVARQGGDEFILIISDIAEHKYLEILCKRIISELVRPFMINGNEIFIGASLGIALAPHDAVEAGDLLRYSDIALYKAKNSGRNRWQFYTPEMAQQMVQRREMENSLREALRLQQFCLVYQPRYNLNNSQIVAVEALIRWQHPQLGLLMPDQFISLAEETGLIAPLSEWVLKTACRDAQQSLDGLAVSVNISALEFQTWGIVDRVSEALRESQLDPGRLEIEVTENATLWNPENSLELMHALKNIGVRLLMDDFGTGYSSLSYLRNFPFDGIKLDKSFISAMPESESANTIVENIIGLGKAFSLSITAEGVETQGQLQKLKMLDCDETQGYLIGKPMTLAELKEERAAMDAAAQQNLDNNT
ncbi:EAL domain-containing protein [Enterobacter sp. R1(2018)]|uniref:bifunctional diguanylate cyclase/phosphodiesterase n=1 Tax=Enterobacter sp. R1(2018) TaxID=2447891 RepID=UPI002877B0C6|nr:EAL domain-containing protein [Enterobacter sp. R1(2018)]